VQVARVPVAVNGIDVDIEHPRRVRSVHQTQNARCATVRRDLLDWEAQRGRACDMVDDHQPCSGVDRTAESCANFIRSTKWQWNVHNNCLASEPLALCLNGLPDRVVSMV